jgi:sRNA-binding protein
MLSYHIESDQKSPQTYKTNTGRPLSPDETACLEILLERWPRCFDLKKTIPFQIGIRKAILAEEPAIPSPELDAVLRWYARRIIYISALARGGKRADLDGKAAGDVSEEHQIAAHQAVEAFGLGGRWLRADGPDVAEQSQQSRPTVSAGSTENTNREPKGGVR